MLSLTIIDYRSNITRILAFQRVKSKLFLPYCILILLARLSVLAAMHALSPRTFSSICLENIGKWNGWTIILLTYIDLWLSGKIIATAKFSRKWQNILGNRKTNRQKCLLVEVGFPSGSSPKNRLLSFLFQIYLVYFDPMIPSDLTELRQALPVRLAGWPGDGWEWPDGDDGGRSVKGGGPVPCYISLSVLVL